LILVVSAIGHAGIVYLIQTTSWELCEGCSLGPWRG
jgi:hypothetical protein